MADQYGITYSPGASARPYAHTDDGSPTRPYADPGQLGGNAPRSPEFATGVIGDPGSAATSLNQASERQNLLTAQQFGKPHSVLQPIGTNPGGLGMSAADAARRLPDGTYLGNPNGMSADQFEPSAMLHLMTGQDTGLDQ